MSDPVFHRPGEGEIHAMGPSTVAIKATGEDTGGGLYLGEVTMRVGDEEQKAPAGTFVCAPPGVVHTFANRSDAPVRFLNFNIPGGWEESLRDLAAAAAAGTPPTPEEIGKIASRYDFRPA